MVKSKRTATKALGRIYGHAANPKISITFDAATFDKLRRVAVKNNVSMGLIIRTLVDRGLLASKIGGE